MTVSPKIIAWHREIDAITLDCQQSFGNLSPEEINWKPNATTWSIAQNIDHLITINRTYFPIIQQIRNDTYALPFWSRFPWLTNYFGKLILKAVDPKRQKKMKTFPIWQPQSGNMSLSIVDNFATHQQELKNLIASTEDLISHKTIIASPANKLIVYPLKTAFDIIVMHEKRHMNQARELLQWQKTDGQKAVSN